MLKVVLAAIAVLAASPAYAADKLLRGPAPEWVKPAEVPTPKATADGPATRILLYDSQARLGQDGDAEYFNVVAEVRTAMGLQMAGSMNIAWDPARDTVTVHHLRIRRGKEVIDVLAKQDFTVIRRETNLERAVLDGVLSATLQPEGLQAGDIVDLAYTRVHRDAVLQGRTDHILRASFGRTDRVRLRALWDPKLALTWSAGEGLEKPKVGKSDGLTEIVVDMRDVEPPKYPAGAPARYFPRREIAVSGFRTWDEVAALMAPLFEKAAVLAPDSPLKAEVARIRAASADPKVRAGLALQLVEDQVRYLALTMNNGGYVPQTPDDTWRRRFGDCKAKTVLLMALLRELGIEAEAAVVASNGGDLLALRPPAVSAFDHVIVRAVIGGKAYWLDGTRMGDRNIDAVATPPFGQALPLRAAGSELIALLQPPPTAPTASTLLRIDARGGLDTPAPIHGEMALTGPMANYFGMAAQSASAADREKMLKGFWRAYPWIEPKTVNLVQEGVTGEARIVMEGTAKLEWLPRSTGPRLLFPPGAGLGGYGPPKREDAGAQADAPFVVAGYPSYSRNRFEIRLPGKGEGFKIQGDDVDRTVAGRRFVRRTKIADGTATIETEIRSLAPEFPASEAQAARDALAEMGRVRVAIRSSFGYRASDDDIAAWGSETPKTAQDYLGRGARYLAAGREELGVADLDKAAELDPKNAWPAANRASFHLAAGKLDLAAADVAKALALDPRNPAALGVQASIAAREGRYEDAVAGLTRVADLSPQNPGPLYLRSRAYRSLGRMDKALADLAEIEKIEPGRLETRLERMQIHASQGDWKAAMAELDAAGALKPGESGYQLAKADLLSRAGQPAEARAVLDQLLAKSPSADGYLTRARIRPKSDVDARLADIGLAEKRRSAPDGYAGLRAQYLIEAARYDQAVAVTTRALARRPADPALLQVRAKAYARAGRTPQATADFATLRRLAGRDVNRLNNLCWDQGTLGFDLTAALADCDAALAINPRHPPTLDSRAFVLLRLDRFKDAAQAYEEVLKIRTDYPDSLYGRGMARLGLGQEEAGRADIAAAEKLRRDVAQQWADYGVVLPAPARKADAQAEAAKPST